MGIEKGDMSSGEVRKVSRQDIQLVRKLLFNILAICIFGLLLYVAFGHLILDISICLHIFVDGLILFF